MSAAYTARKFLVIGYGSVKGDYETAVDHVLKFLVEVGEVVLPVGLFVFVSGGFCCVWSRSL